MRRPPAGFTLLEVLVALAVLGTAVAIILQLFSANIRSVVSAEDYVAAAVAGEVKMREVLENAKLQEPDSWSESTEDGYRFDISLSDTLKDRTDPLPVKLLQVDLTVRWRKGLSEKSIGLKTIKMVNKQETVETVPSVGKP